MKKTKSILFALLAIVIFQTSCTVHQRSIADSNSRLNFESEDFIISQPYAGQAHQTKILGIDWSRLFGFKAGHVTGAAPIVGFSGQLTPVDYFAMYDLVNRNPNFDALIYPSFKRKYFNVLYIYQRTEVEVTARLGKLDVDNGAE